MLTYEDALARILRGTPAPRVASVPLDDALGLTLARSIRAPVDLPRFDNSAVDGYAIRIMDGPSQPDETPSASWRVIGAAEAGRPFRGTLRAGQAVRILTGAQVPRGAEAILMQEQAQRQGDRLIARQPSRPGQHIRRRGEDLRRGVLVLAAGTTLRPQELGLLAAMGYRAAPVYPRPTVAVLATGDELQAPGSRLKPGGIYESNSYLLTALIRCAGARAIRLGLVRDVPHSLERAMRRGLRADVLIVSGGVSVGDKDFVRRVARRCGVRQRFWQVSIKPGMPVFFGRCQRTMVFGLPGNPVSAFVTFEEFVTPALHRLMGRPWRDRYVTVATLAQELRPSMSRRTHFIRVRVGSDNGQPIAQPLGGQGSHQLRSLAEADGWIRVTADEGPFAAGTTVMVKQSEGSV